MHHGKIHVHVARFNMFSAICNVKFQSALRCSCRTKLTWIQRYQSLKIFLYANHPSLTQSLPPTKKTNFETPPPLKQSMTNTPPPFTTPNVTLSICPRENTPWKPWLSSFFLSSWTKLAIKHLSNQIVAYTAMRTKTYFLLVSVKVFINKLTPLHQFPNPIFLWCLKNLLD